MTRFVYAHALLAATMLATVPTAEAQDDWRARERERYAACMDRAVDHPKAAFDDATQWENLGGGYPARHCALAALVELGHYGEAAQGLEKLAQKVGADARFKSNLLVQAAGAWIAFGDGERARAVADAALNLRPQTPDGELAPALMVRARALALLGAYWEAADDLSRILYADPRDAEALVLRGAAYRQLDAFDLALDDLNRALGLAPGHPEGLLERGIVKRLLGDKAGARADWRRLIAEEPQSEAAREAETNLHALDSGLD